MRFIRFGGLSKRVLIAIFVIALGFSFKSASIASAAGAPLGTLTFSLISFSCNSITVSVQNHDSVSFHSSTGVAVNNSFGTVGTNTDTELPNSSGTLTISFSPVVSGFITVIGGGDTSDSWEYSYTCDLGGSSTPVAPTGVVVGPFIPGNFLLRTITCNTPAYTTASGIPVITGEHITAGQTWFVNPMPVIIGKTSWTEFFDAGFINAFIPTACVGGKPAGYLGA